MAETELTHEMELAPPLTATDDVHFGKDRASHRRTERGKAAQQPEVPPGRVPRVSRLMAQAIGFQCLLDQGCVEDCAPTARFGHMARARVNQIMNLTLLAPGIQEAILLLPRVTGEDPITEIDLRPIEAEADWGTQRRLWRRLKARRLGVRPKPQNGL